MATLKRQPLVDNFTTHLRVYTAYLLDQANVSIEYDCYPSLSTNLPVTIKDMEENVIIPTFSVRSGIDQLSLRPSSIKAQNDF